MTQLIVSVEDTATLRDVKKAITMLRGVSCVRVNRQRKAYTPNAETIKAIEEVERGETIKCGTMEGYCKLVGYDV